MLSARSTSAIHTKVESSLIIQLSCGNTLKSPLRARTFWVRAAASVSAGQPQCTVKIVTNRGQSPNGGCRTSTLGFFEPPKIKQYAHYVPRSGIVPAFAQIIVLWSAVCETFGFAHPDANPSPCGGL